MIDKNGVEVGELSYGYSKSPPNIPVVFSHREAEQVIALLLAPYDLKTILM